jgi:hypothetical protein
LARQPRVSAGEEQARSVADVEALATLLPVTGGPEESAIPVDLQIEIREEARDVLARGAATPQEADRLWVPLPACWRSQWRRAQGTELPSVYRIRAVDPAGDLKA